MPAHANHVAPRQVEVTRGDEFRVHLRRAALDSAYTGIDITSTVITAELLYGPQKIADLTVDKTDPESGRYAVVATEAQTASWPVGYLWLRVAYDGPSATDKNSLPPIPVRTY